ncbi:MAG: hypothetical protein ACREQ9_07270 [Candidatus Binatia bacterium]
MGKVFTCADGAVVRGESDDELVANVESHLAEAHPRLAGSLSRGEIVDAAVEEAAPNGRDRRKELAR